MAAPRYAPISSGIPKHEATVEATMYSPAQSVHAKDEAFERARTDIVLATSLVTIPMLALSFVFIGLVVRYNVAVDSHGIGEQISSGISVSLYNVTSSVTGAYFVDISSTRLVTVASWTSTVIGFLPAWVMLLYAYPLSATFIRTSPGRLPTPVQFRILIDLLSASYGTLCTWHIRPLYRSKHRNRKNRIVDGAGGALLSCVLLGASILAADTWLHLTTSTVILQETQPVTGNYSLLSKQVSPSCFVWRLCTIANGRTSSLGQISDPSTAYQTLYDVSNETRIAAVDLEPESESPDGSSRSISFYISATIPADISYNATTYALDTQCWPITQMCNLTAQLVCLMPGGVCPATDAYSNTLPFSCSSSLKGDLSGYQTIEPLPLYNVTSPSDSNFFMTYFKDKALTQYYDAQAVLIQAPDNLTQVFRGSQPMYSVVGGLVTTDPNSILYNSTELVMSSDTSQDALLLECSAQVVALSYTWSVSSGYSNLVSFPVNDSMAASIMAPHTSPKNPALEGLVTGLRTAGIQSTMTGLTAAYSRAYSQIVLAMGVGAVIPASSTSERLTTLRQISRLPKAPFFTLVILDLLYAALGLAFGVVAWMSRPRQVKPVQVRLSTTGLVATLFEGQRAERNVKRTNDLFAENVEVSTSAHDMRVGMEQTAQGGWRFRRI